MRTGRCPWTVGATAGALLLVVLPALGSDARSAVESFVAGLRAVEFTDLSIEQRVTLYNPDGLHPSVRGEQRVFLRPPGRQRFEQAVEGKREVRLVVDGRTWLRHADGKTAEVSAGGNGGSELGVLVPGARTADQLLDEWRAQGIRTDVSHSERVAGRPVTVIGATPGDRDSPAAWLDAQYGVVRFVVRERTSSGSALVDRVFSEHRPLVGGFFFPWRQETFVGGKLLLLVTVRAVRVNTGLPDALFDPEALRRER